MMGHPIWSVEWATNQAAGALKEGLSSAGRQRSDIHFNAWFLTLVSNDPKDAINDAKGTVAVYAGVSQYEEYFAAHGFRQEAVRCQAAVQRGDYLSAASAIPDEMARTFVICGTPDEARRRLEPVWNVVDSLCLVPPIGGVPPAKLISYVAAIGQTFYA